MRHKITGQPSMHRWENSPRTHLILFNTQRVKQNSRSCQVEGQTRLQISIKSQFLPDFWSKTLKNDNVPHNNLWIQSPPSKPQMWLLPGLVSTAPILRIDPGAQLVSLIKMNLPLCKITTMLRRLIEKKPTKMMESMEKYPTRVHQLVSLCKKTKAANTSELLEIISLSQVIKNPQMLISKELVLRVNLGSNMCSLWENRLREFHFLKKLGVLCPIKDPKRTKEEKFARLEVKTSKICFHKWTQLNKKGATNCRCKTLKFIKNCVKKWNKVLWSSVRRSRPPSNFLSQKLRKH